MSCIPTNPNDPYYLRNCFACKAKAKEDQEYIRNYGGVVCFSCRAFFRRAHQKSTPPTFTCKRGGACAVTVTNRRKCQKCRMDRCAIAGMSKGAILTEEQKKKRFRKMLQKRQQAGPQSTTNQMPSTSGTFSAFGTNPSTSEHAPNSDLAMEIGDFPQPTRTRSDGCTQTTLPFDPKSTLMIHDIFRNIFESRLQENPNFLWGNASPDPRSKTRNQYTTLVNKKIRDITSCYQKTLESTGNSLLSKLSALNSGDLTVQIRRKEILNFILQLSEDYKLFAFQQRRFQQLQPQDQQALLLRNTPLYVQFQLVSLVLRPDHSGKTLAGNKQTKKVWMKDYHFNLFLERFNAVTKLFKEDCDLDFYGRLVNKIKSFSQMNSIEKTAVLVYLILFDYDETTLLRCPEDLEDVTIENEMMFEKFIPNNKYCLTFEELTKTLTKMALFCSYFMEWDDLTINKTGCVSESKSPCSGIVMPYTREEEYFIMDRFKQMEETYRSVQIGHDFVEEFVRFTMGLPVSNLFFPRYLQGVLERLWRVLKLHPEFEELTAEARLQMMRKNGVCGMALNTVRGEKSTLMQQIQNGFGDVDEAKLREMYPSILENANKLRSATLSTSPLFSVEQKTHYTDLITNAQVLNLDPTLFKLNMFLTMTKPAPGTSNSFSKVHFTYSNLLKRRLDYLSKSNCGSTFNHIRDPDEVFSQIMTSLGTLGDIAPYLMIVMKKVQPLIPYLN